MRATAPTTAVAGTGRTSSAISATASRMNSSSLAVKSCRSAEVLRRYWNSRLTQDQIEAGCGIVCSLRGDALAAYIEKQEMLIGVLTTTHAVDGEVAIRAM